MVEEGRAVDRVAADTDRRRDADAHRLHLRRGLVAERARARDHADIALKIDVTRHDAEHGLAGADDAGAVRAHQHRALLFGIAVEVALHSHHVLRRDAVGDRADQLYAGVGGFHDGVGAEGRRHEGDAGGGSGRLHRFLHGVEHRQALMLGAAFARGNAANHVGAVLHHFLGVEGSFVARHALDDDRGGFVDKNAHWFSPGGRASALALAGSCAALQASTALRAASAKVSAVISSSPLPARILRPSSTLVPASRTTSGTFTSTVWQACTTPLATQSQRLMPAKMFTSTAFTLASDRTSLSAVAIRSGEAPPPTSRRVAGLPPACLIISMVAMARPAPLTMQPISPSSPI